MLVRSSLVAVAFLAFGCAEKSAAPPPSTAALPPEPVAGKSDNAPPSTADSEPAARTEGSSKEKPFVRCGPMDSYVFVAKEFKCADGSNPLGGDPKAGAAARVGNVGANASGHIIDLYEVPCPEGTRRVYVDMYGCGGGAPAPGGSKI